MIYKPSTGRFKDTSIVWHEGKYYLFSMYTHAAEERFNNVWMAVSDNGVHWEDIGPAIKDAPFNIWAMSVHKVGDRFIMNHGSFTRPDVQNVIRFWESTDLVNWTFMGYESDLGPDKRWYHPDSRLDCACVIPVTEDGKDKYYGYATGPGGFLESNDGIHWQGMPQPEIDWDMVPPPPTPEDEGGFEVGGCHEINGKFYLVGGWFNYMGGSGYGVYTLIGDTPTGPFHADAAAYRLCGNSTRWIAMWARFIQTDTELLINGYMYSGYTYETGETYLPPIKKAVVDKNGHLHLGYWDGNEAIKGEPLDVDLGQSQRVYPIEGNEECLYNLTDDGLDIQAQPERNSIMRTNIPTTVTILDTEYNFNKGVVVEGSILTTCKDPRLVAPSAGFYLEETPNEGTAIMLHSCGRTEIGKMTLTDQVTFDVEDIIGPGCASTAGISPHTPHKFRLFIRKNMFELYLDDMLVQTFNTTHIPETIGNTPKRLGFIAQNGQVIVGNLKVWSMSLEE